MVKKENVKVMVRFRPPDQREISHDLHYGPIGNLSLRYDEQRAEVVAKQFPSDVDAADVELGLAAAVASQATTTTFTFDRVFSPVALQSRIFHEVAQEAMLAIPKGYNSAIFAYGQTGSGKTYSMYGPPGSTPKERGIVPRCAEMLFLHLSRAQETKEVTVTCSFLEVYQERIIDLFAAVDRLGVSVEQIEKAKAAGKPISLPKKKFLKLRESSVRGVYVQGLLEKQVTSADSVVRLMSHAEHYRAVATTKMNEHSSRSHTVLCLKVTQRLKDRSLRVGKLNLVDLAGSENVRKSGATGKSLKESKMINRSLSALGNVIYALTDRYRSHVPYRDSTLTFMLRESLGGNTKTVLLVTCSPHALNFTETMSTLRFAQRAKSIQNQPKVNDLETTEQLHFVVTKLKTKLKRSEARVAELEALLRASGTDMKSYQNLQLMQSVKEAALSQENGDGDNDDDSYNHPFPGDHTLEDLKGMELDLHEPARTRRELLLLQHVKTSNNELISLRKQARENIVRNDRLIRTNEAVSLLEDGAIFTKYPFNRRFFSRASRKRVVYDRRTQLLYWHKASQGTYFNPNNAKCISLNDVESVVCGANSTAFDIDPDIEPNPHHCFSVICHDRTLDLEADNQSTRDAWVAAIEYLLVPENRSVELLASSVIHGGVGQWGNSTEPSKSAGWVIPPAKKKKRRRKKKKKGLRGFFGRNKSDESDMGSGGGGGGHAEAVPSSQSSPQVKQLGLRGPAVSRRRSLVDPYGDASADEVYDYEFNVSVSGVSSNSRAGSPQVATGATTSTDPYTSKGVIASTARETTTDTGPLGVGSLRIDAHLQQLLDEIEAESTTRPAPPPATPRSDSRSRISDISSDSPPRTGQVVGANREHKDVATVNEEEEEVNNSYTFELLDSDEDSMHVRNDAAMAVWSPEPDEWAKSIRPPPGHENYYSDDDDDSDNMGPFNPGTARFVGNRLPAAAAAAAQPRSPKKTPKSARQALMDTYKRFHGLRADAAGQGKKGGGRKKKGKNKKKKKKKGGKKGKHSVRSRSQPRSQAPRNSGRPPAAAASGSGKPRGTRAMSAEVALYPVTLNMLSSDEEEEEDPDIAVDDSDDDEEDEAVHVPPEKESSVSLSSLLLDDRCQVCGVHVGGGAAVVLKGVGYHPSCFAKRKRGRRRK